MVHNDIKLENICATVNSAGELKFKLIDFGVSGKVRKLGQNNYGKCFRGNF